ncbi:MAG: DUF4113 domain-containing protein, partial [Methylovulum sp.]|nr:DUF4113 domain-containing protein [Methylovulum sp.]
QYQRAASLKLGVPTQDTRLIVTQANRLLEGVFRTGYKYHKCGVQLSHIQPEALPRQLELFDFADAGLQKENRPLMKTVDQINRRFPQGISIAATGFKKTWKPKAERISPCYTTHWQELMKVNCD